jgi:hypothetical protein
VLARSSNPPHGETGSCVRAIRCAHVRIEAACSPVVLAGHFRVFFFSEK